MPENSPLHHRVFVSHHATHAVQENEGDTLRKFVMQQVAAVLPELIDKGACAISFQVRSYPFLRMELGTNCSEESIRSIQEIFRSIMLSALREMKKLRC